MRMEENINDDFSSDDQINLPDERSKLENEYKEQLIRCRAEMENQRKRMEREMDNARKFALQEFITELLPAKDSMEKGLDISVYGGWNRWASFV